MFLLEKRQVIYKDPWIKSFEFRIQQLTSKNKKVAYFYETPDNSTFRYRVYNMVQTLNELSEETSASYFFTDDFKYLDLILSCCSIIVICRTRYSDSINQLITIAKSKGLRIFFDIDDLVFNPSYIHLILHSLDQDLKHPQVWDHWFAYSSRLGETLRLCDAAITTNQHLANQIQLFTSKPVYIIPNFMNQDQLEISDFLFQQKILSSFKRDPNLHIGYFSGTPTHNKDFEIVLDSLIELLEKYPGLVLRVAGYTEFKEKLNQYASRVEVIPFQDFINLQYWIASTEINIVPLQDNIFTNSKSELKFFEAAIVGTVTVASPTFTYRSAISDGVNGYLANSFEWFEKLDNLIGCFDNYAELAVQAQKDAAQKYAWYNQLRVIEDALFSEKPENFETEC